MRQIKKTKKRKKKVDTEITPQKHERIGNMNFYSEEVASEIVKKLISYAITKSYGKSVDNKMANFCYSLIDKSLYTLTSQITINYDKDDVNISPNIIYLNTENKSYKQDFHKKCVTKRNQKAEKFLLNSNNKKLSHDLNPDDIDIEKIKNKDNKIQIDNNKNYWGCVSEPISNAEDRMMEQKNPMQKFIRILKIKKDTKNQENLEKRSIEKRRTYKKLTSKSITRSNQKQLSNIQKKSTFIQKNLSKTNLNIVKDVDKNLESFKIIDKEYDKKEPIEIIKLRKQKMEEILAKQEEIRIENEKKLLEAKRIKNEFFLQKLNGEKSEKKRKNFKGEVTTDADGKIVYIKKITPDILPNEFSQIVINQKDILHQSNQIEKNKYQKERHEMEISANKNIEYNHRSSLEFQNTNKSLDIKNNSKIEPSGSNFKLINPEVGVKVYENEKTKSGGEKYYEKYQKYSVSDFKKMIQNSFTSNKKKMIFLNNNNNDNNSSNILNSNIMNSNNINSNMMNTNMINTNSNNFINNNINSSISNINNETNTIMYDTSLNTKYIQKIPVNSGKNFHQTAINFVNYYKQKPNEYDPELYLTNNNSQIFHKILFSMNSDDIKKKENKNNSMIEGENMIKKTNQKNIFKKKFYSIEKGKIEDDYSLIDRLNRNLVMTKSNKYLINNYNEKLYKNATIKLPKIKTVKNMNSTASDKFSRIRIKKVIENKKISKNNSNIV